LRDNFDKISETGWNNLLKNPSAKNFLKKNYDKIPQQLKHICHEPLPIDQYETSHEYWSLLSACSSNFGLLRDNIDHIDWYSLSSNPHIYEYDYATMKTNMDVLREELLQKALHPRRVLKWIVLECDDMLE
jgi:hypothetical protein